VSLSGAARLCCLTIKRVGTFGTSLEIGRVMRGSCRSPSAHDIGANESNMDVATNIKTPKSRTAVPSAEGPKMRTQVPFSDAPVTIALSSQMPRMQRYLSHAAQNAWSTLKPPMNMRLPSTGMDLPISLNDGSSIIACIARSRSSREL
jgi:hypothetical protein